jgi:hypothetical protein
MSNITIACNYQFRDVLYWYDLTDKERKEFDYLLTSEKCSTDEANFFRYRGVVYDLGEFMRVDGAMFGQLSKWDGYQSDSYFSGIVVRYNKDFDAVIAGTYYS